MRNQTKEMPTHTNATSPVTIKNHTEPVPVEAPKKPGNATLPITDKPGNATVPVVIKNHTANATESATPEEQLEKPRNKKKVKKARKQDAPATDDEQSTEKAVEKPSEPEKKTDEPKQEAPAASLKPAKVTPKEDGEKTTRKELADKKDETEKKDDAKAAKPEADQKKEEPVKQAEEPKKEEASADAPKVD